MLTVVGGVGVGSGGFHGRVKLDMFENSGLALRFFSLFLFLFTPLSSNRLLATRLLVSKSAGGRRCSVIFSVLVNPDFLSVLAAFYQFW